MALEFALDLFVEPGSTWKAVWYRTSAIFKIIYLDFCVWIILNQFQKCFRCWGENERLRRLKVFIIAEDLCQKNIPFFIFQYFNIKGGHFQSFSVTLIKSRRISEVSRIFHEKLFRLKSLPPGGLIQQKLTW